MRSTALTIGFVSTLMLGPAHAGMSVFDGRIGCPEQQGVLFCEGDLTTRVESFDGVPLDVNVTLPMSPPPYPLIIDEHGWSLGKAGGPFVAQALAGYAVLSYSARGFHGSCGLPDARLPDVSLTDPNVCATRGWTRLADARYEARDAQHLAGILADEGVIDPVAIGVTGISYGGGRTIILAALRNRVMLEDGTLIPWKSPGGLDMAIAAGAALIPWSDLAASLQPPGTTLDYRTDNPYGPRGGIRKGSWNELLYTIGQVSGFYAPLGADPDADLAAWDARSRAGEPYDDDPVSRDTVDELTAHHSGYYIDDSVPPAPLFIYNAWTDDLFPANEGLRYWLKTHAKHPSAELAVLFADDFGHPRASLAGAAPIGERVNAFFARHLLGTGDPLPAFETYTQACNGAAVAGPFTGDTWDALHPGEVLFTTDDTHTFDERGGDAATADALDPLNGPSCRTVPDATDPGAARYALPPATGAGYTLLGSPTIIADYVVAGVDFAQVAGRLWDVAPDGTRALVTHGFYRPRSDNLNPQVFQLPPNGWHFAAGHAPVLELLGQSVPAGWPSSGPFSVAVRRLELRLPVNETPDGTTITLPAAHTMPPSAPTPPPCSLTPEDTCVPSDGNARLAMVRGKRAAKNRFTWQWQGDSAVPFAVAIGDRGATFCLYDATGALRFGVTAPASGLCGKGPCWSAETDRGRYADRKRARGGLRTIGLKRKAGTVRVAMAGAGAGLSMPTLPLPDGGVTAQLRFGDGTCVGTAFATVDTNTASRVKAKE